MASSGPISPDSQSAVTAITNLSTSTITAALPTTDVSTSVKTTITITTVAVGAATASVSADTSCTMSSVATESMSTTGVTSPMTTSPLVISTPYTASGSSYWGVTFVNSTLTVTVGTVAGSSVHVTEQSFTRSTVSTSAPDVNFTSGTATGYPANPTIPVSSGTGAKAKPPCSLPWGGNDGGGSHTCVVMMTMVIAVSLQVLL
ncbi:hypothetical protein F4802DRAFT_562870, partial [Xylaria palmicola]